jgi:hypothetical protein
MRVRVWLLVLMASMVLACKKDEAPETKNAKAAALPGANTPFTLKITFEGLVGYINKSDAVWALLPKASADYLPAGVAPQELMEFPEHYAFLKVNGMNVEGLNVATDILIPIDGKEIQVSDDFTTGSGIPQDPFKQKAADSRDKLDPSVLTAKVNPQLAARIKLPLINAGDWKIETNEPDGSVPDFANFDPVPSGNFCIDGFKTVEDPRVQAVTWSKKVPGAVTLKIQSIGGTSLPKLVLVSAGGQDVQISIVNKEWQALYNQSYVGHHSPAYRWFYNLSDASVKSDCTKHYYPRADAGGNRCPQKLYN